MSVNIDGSDTQLSILEDIVRGIVRENSITYKTNTNGIYLNGWGITDVDGMYYEVEKSVSLDLTNDYVRIVDKSDTSFMKKYNGLYYWIVRLEWVGNHKGFVYSKHLGNYHYYDPVYVLYTTTTNPNFMTVGTTITNLKLITIISANPSLYTINDNKILGF